MTKVSVIVPVYNGEKYIKSCLDSILKQTLKEIEIIIINDGSTDSTQEILENYQNQYNDKIKIIKKENEGQGKARNVGIDLSKGEFITFIDADDEIEPNMLQSMYELLKKEDADIVICDYYEIYEKNKVLRKAIPQRQNDIKKDYIVSVAGPCNKLIRTEILTKNQLHFMQTGAYEDLSIIPLIGLYANKIVYLEEPLYNYYIRQGSTMRQNTFNDKVLSIYEVLEYLTKEFEKSGLSENYKEELEFIYIKHLLYAGTGRFLEYKEGIYQVEKVVEIMKKRYPNWSKNQYYKKQSKVFKLNCKIFYSNKLWLILLFQKFKNILKKGMSWNS